jgi:hypothetical protein
MRSSGWGRVAGVVATLAPLAILLGPFLVILVVDGSVLLSGAKSGRAVGLTLGFAAAWVIGAYFVLPRLLPRRWPRCAVLCVVAAVITGFVAIPAFRSTEVVEVRAGLDAVRRPSPSIDGSTATSTVTSTTAAPDGPVQLSTGRFTGIDHRAEGTANVFRQADGRLVVELHDINFQSGPDYVVYLVPGRDARTPTDDAADLGRIKGNKGTQYYDVPAGFPTDISNDRPHTVLVWCRAFSVPIGNAPQLPV